MFRPVSALLELPRRALRGRPRLRPRSRLTNKLLLVFAALGPGLIAANAGNDAGGIATYASVGAKYGYDLLWMMVVITVSLIVVQEMAARMGAVTGKGLAELIREQYGVRWSAFATVSVLSRTSVSASASSSASAPRSASPTSPSTRRSRSPPCSSGCCSFAAPTSVAERIFVLMTIPFFAYPIAAILAKPHWGHVGHAIVVPHVQLNSGYLFLFIATAGTTITPFMQLYVQSAVVEKGVGPEQLNAERAEVVSGSIFANLIAMFIIVATGATLFVHGEHNGQQRRRRRESARAVRGPLRRSAVRRRPARRKPARGGDPAGDRRLRDRRDVRLRKGNQATGRAKHPSSSASSRR